MPSKQFLPVDKYGLRPSIDTVHKRIHDKIVFTATYTETITSGSASSILIAAPASVDIHMTLDIEANNSGSWTWSKAPNATGGTIIVSNNHDQSSTETDPLLGLITDSPTVTSVGTVLEYHIVGTTGVGNSSGGGSGLIRDEWLLDPASPTKYLIQFTASANSSLAYNVTFYQGDA